MVEIGGKPLLWHIMKIYSHYGFNDFVICCGYKGYVIKEYFANYFLHNSDTTFDFSNNKVHTHEHFVEPWRVTVVDTGDRTMTGGRLKRVTRYLNPGEPFCFTYGDGLADINVKELVHFHQSQKRLATVSVIQQPGRFGVVQLKGNAVENFIEKPEGNGGWINGGFFVLQPEVLEYISGDESIWERQPMEKLARDNQMSAYSHRNFWCAMDTLRDKNLLEDLWNSQKAPWKVWN